MEEKRKNKHSIAIEMFVVTILLIVFAVLSLLVNGHLAVIFGLSVFICIGFFKIIIYLADLYSQPEEDEEIECVIAISFDDEEEVEEKPINRSKRKKDLESVKSPKSPNMESIKIDNDNKKPLQKKKNVKSKKKA